MCLIVLYATQIVLQKELSECKSHSEMRLVAKQVESDEKLRRFKTNEVTSTKLVCLKVQLN